MATHKDSANGYSGACAKRRTGAYHGQRTGEAMHNAGVTQMIILQGIMHHNLFSCRASSQKPLRLKGLLSETSSVEGLLSGQPQPTRTRRSPSP